MMIEDEEQAEIWLSLQMDPMRGGVESEEEGSYVENLQIGDSLSDADPDLSATLPYEDSFSEEEATFPHKHYLREADGEQYEGDDLLTAGPKDILNEFARRLTADSLVRFSLCAKKCKQSADTVVKRKADVEFFCDLFQRPQQCRNPLMFTKQTHMSIIDVEMVFDKVCKFYQLYYEQDIDAVTLMEYTRQQAEQLGYGACRGYFHLMIPVSQYQRNPRRDAVIDFDNSTALLCKSQTAGFLTIMALNYQGQDLMRHLRYLQKFIQLDEHAPIEKKRILLQFVYVLDRICDAGSTRGQVCTIALN